MFSFIITIFLFFFLSAPLANALEGPVVRTSHVAAQFITADNVWSPGKQHRLAIYFDIVDDWHLYWKNPGDSGIPTNVRWRLPEGVRIKQTNWPYPERIPYGPLTNFGYHESVAILFTVDHSQFRAAESSSKAGRSLRIEADVDWLVCKETCIPEKGAFRITVPIGGKAKVDEKSAKTIEYFESRIPRALTDQMLADQKVHAIADPRWLVLNISRSILDDSIKTVDFFPEADLLLQHNHSPRFIASQSMLQIYMSRNTTASERPPPRLKGALVVGSVTTTVAYEIDTQLQVSQKRITVPRGAIINTGVASGGMETIIGVRGFHSGSASSHGQGSLGAPQPESVGAPAGVGALSEGVNAFKALLFALLGGLLLNLMPCVFPVLAIKALGFIKHAGTAKARLHGLLYGGGVLSSFVVLGLALILLRAAGTQLGWGFHLQSSSFLAFLILLLFSMALNFFGFFEFMGSFMGIGQRLTEGDSKLSSFFTGILVVVVATPCSAPFMGTAIGASLTLPTGYTLLIFLFLGVGLALPYVLLSHVPQFVKWMPKPGAWMQTFREALGFPMLGTCIWLIWVLAQQAGADGVVIQLSAMALLVFAIWLNHKIPTSFSLPITTALILLSFVFAISGVSDVQKHTLGKKEHSFATDLIPWGTYSETEIKKQLDAGKTVFVNFTAAWCITCKVNERIAFASSEVRAVFEDGKVVGLIGDWTNRDPEITKALSRHGRLGVPLYLVYKPGSEKPRILPQILTPQIMLDSL